MIALAQQAVVSCTLSCGTTISTPLPPYNDNKKNTARHTEPPLLYLEEEFYILNVKHQMEKKKKNTQGATSA